MARRSRGSKRSGRGKGRRSGGRLSSLLERFKTVFTSLILLAAGALIGSFWLEWRDAELPENAPSVSGPSATERRIKVEVLNGSGEPGAARVVGDLLLTYGYDVVTVDNADAFDYGVTHVIDRSDVGEPIGELAGRIGSDSTYVALEPDLLLDATIILGADWRERLPDR